MITLPSLSNVRYEVGKPTDHPPYVWVSDLLGGKSLWGRKLPKQQNVKNTLDLWLDTSHPHFLQVCRYLEKEDHYLVLLEPVMEPQPLSNLREARSSAQTIFSLMTELANAFHFLSHHQRYFPKLDLSRMFLTSKGLRISGHETAQKLVPSKLEEGPLPLDLRYAAPEVVNGEVRTQKSDIYHLGALFGHLLTGAPVKGGEELELAERWIEWRSLLMRMLHPMPAGRPTWPSFWKSFRANRQQRVVVHQPVWLRQQQHGAQTYLKDRLLDRLETPRAVALQMPADGLVSRLLPFVHFAEEKNFLVFHCEAEREEADAFKVVNYLITLIVQGVIAHLDRSDLLEEVQPHWQPIGQTGAVWQQVLKRLLPELIGTHCEGIVLIIEHIQNLDKASMEPLATLISWFAEVPLFMVVTGHCFSHDRFQELKERLPLAWTFYHPSALNEDQAHESIWTPDEGTREVVEQGLKETDSQENLLHYWMKDHFYKTGCFLEYLNDAWSKLSAGERAIMQLIACTYRALSKEELDVLSGRRTQRFLSRLHRIRFIDQRANDWTITIPALLHFVRKHIQKRDQIAIRERLYHHEAQRSTPDIVQLALLASTTQGSSFDEHLEALKEQALVHFNFDCLWRIVHAYAGGGQTAFKELVQWAKLVQGRPVLKRHLSFRSELSHVATGCCLRGKNPIKAADAYLKAGSKRTFHPNQKGYCYVLTIECAFEAGDELLANRIARRFRRLEPQLDLTNRHWKQRIQGVQILFNQVVEFEETDTPISLWLQACQYWMQSRFRRALACLESAIPVLREEPDLNWRGHLFKLYGNILFRNNLPQHAANAYRAARDCFRQTENELLISQLAFNMASADNLGGNYDLARSQFVGICREAELSKDRVTQCQALYNLMIADLFQNRLESYRMHFKEHNELAKKIGDNDELLKGLALHQHQALAHSKDQNEEYVQRIEFLLERKSIRNRLIVDEARFAMRLSYFALGYSDIHRPSEPTVFTRWRHRLVDFLIGSDDITLSELLDQVGSGYMKGCHFFLLKTVIEQNLLSRSDRSQKLNAAFENHINTANAAYGELLRYHLQDIEEMRGIGRHHWKMAIGLFENLTIPPSPSFQKSVLTALKSIWSFQEWGVLCKSRKEMVPLEGVGSAADASVKAHVARLEHLWHEPLHTVSAAEHGASRHMLLLPVGTIAGQQSIAWFSTDDDVSADLSNLFKIIFRFYGRMLSFTLQSEQAENTERLVGNTFGIIGRSPALLKAIKKIKQFGKSDLNVYIWGESGTGKEMAARAIHLSSSRADQPFRAINCSHYSESLVESELFGHVKGAFTGADTDRKGVLERANGGTLFLDEIGDVGPKIQSLLLRVFQEGEFCRVGDTEMRTVDIRFVSATNKNLHELIDLGQFREDLFFRLVEEEIHLPPLRERLEDVPDLVQHFLHKYQPDRNLIFLKGFFTALTQYQWPGNVRELESYVHRVLVRWENNEKIGPNEVIPFLRGKPMPKKKERDVMPTLEVFINQCRSELVKDRLEQFGGNRSRAAESLGITRQAVVKIIERYQIDA